MIAERPTQVLDGVQRRERDPEGVRIRGETEEGGIDMQLRCFSVSSPASSLPGFCRPFGLFHCFSGILICLSLSGAEES